ncbi:MAG: translocation/assembly module TamB domain-containing protein [Gemmatimonadaceae bacterium]|nr:translocation/assembly module TamB domain-containing protein [Gemmatimonadaceae bacterium]
MSRRRVVVLASAATIFLLVGLLGLALVFTTRTDWGREQIRSYVQNTLNSRVKGGKWHVGRISGSLFTELVVDSFAIREPNDSLFISTGRVSVRFDPRDLWDRRILVRELRVEHPVVYVRQDSLEKWNFRKIFPSGPPGAPRTTRNFGDYIVVTNAELHQLAFHLTMPWEPADSLSGARRDSAVTHGLTRPDKKIRRSGGHFTITRSWTQGDLRVAHARIADPDSAGRFFLVERLDVDEFDPPLRISNAVGTVRLLGDSAWVDFSRFQLPGSRGSGAGKVWWGSDLPARYDLKVRGDSVSLADVDWVYPTLPTTGGGSMDLTIRNERDLHVLDYVLSNMDVETTGSRLRGSMTFGVGGPVLIVKDVDVETTPIDWALIEQLSGEPLPFPWRGKITARVRASGGPVNRFTVDDATFAFVDANVPGARASGRARGDLDILFPAFTRFNGFDVTIDRFDLATLQFLNPAFPRLDGWIDGRARLDSVWTDVRFRSGDITHHFEELPASRVTGSGRVTIGEKFLTYDVAMQASPIELTTIARAWPELALEQRGSLTGPVRLQGTAEDLDVSTELTGAPGTYGFDGRVDIDSVGGYAWRGSLRFTDANLRVLYDTSSLPITALTGSAEVDVRGDSLANYVGTLGIDLMRSRIDSTRLYEGARARLAFLDGRLRIDSLGVETPIGRLRARGGLGLRADQADSMSVRLEADSLGGLRPYLNREAVDSVARAAVDNDSLFGEVTASLTLAGSIDTLDVRGSVDARALDAFRTTAERARVQLDLVAVGLPGLRGTASATGDTVAVAGIVFRHAAIDATFHDADSVDVRLMAEQSTGPTIDATANVGTRGDTTTVLLSQGRVGFGDHEWLLDRPGRIRWWPEAFAIDSVSLAGNRGAHLLVHGTASDVAPVAMRLMVDSMALEDLAALGQSRVKLAGAMSLDVRATGTRLDPILDVRGRLVGTKVGQVNLAETSLSGRYADRRFTGALAVLRGDTAVLQVEGNVPVDLAFASRSRRLLDDSMRVSVVSRDVDLKLVESFTPAVSNAAGRLNANLSIAGRPRATALEGFVRVDSARAFVTDLGVEVRDFFADLRAARDTIRIERFSMLSGETARSRLSLDGFVALNNAEDREFSLNLNATNFHVVDRRRIGDLTMSAGLRFRGRESASVLTGDVTVDNGYIVIPELTSKQIVDIDDPEFAALVDTSLTGTRAVLPELPRLLRGLTAQNVQIAMGSDVRLRSSEANIKLGGSVNVIRASGLSATGVPQLAVEGALRTERGTFLMRFGDVLYRLFSIEGGEVRFFGDADFNPTLNIRALYSVRQASQLYSNRNIRIRALLLGTLAQPRIALESADSLQLSQSDLIAYLLTGRPSGDIGGLDASYDLLLTNIGSSLSARYSGRFFDYIQLQSVSGSLSNLQNTRRSQSLFAGLAGTQLGVGKQLNDRTFASLTTGFCPLQQFLGGAAATNNFRASEMIGFSLEYTIRSGLGVSVSREPPLAAMLCSNETLGFAATRGSQWSLDLFRTWRW